MWYRTLSPWINGEIPCLPPITKWKPDMISPLAYSVVLWYDRCLKSTQTYSS